MSPIVACCCSALYSVRCCLLLPCSICSQALLFIPQVEIVTYSGPNRRLWMGPQFKFKTYNSNSIAVSNQSPALFNSSATPEAHATSDIICHTTDLESLQYVQCVLD